LEIVLKRPPDQPRRVRVLDETGRRDRAWNADANGGHGTSRLLQIGDERDEGGEGGVVVVARRVDAKARELAAAVEDDAFGFRAAEIDAYSPVQPGAESLEPCPFSSSEAVPIPKEYRHARPRGWLLRRGS